MACFKELRQAMGLSYQLCRNIAWSEPSIKQWL